MGKRRLLPAAPQADLFSSVFMVIGGGPAVAVANIFTMVSDVVPTENWSGVLFLFRFSSDSGVEQLFSFLLRQACW